MSPPWDNSSVCICLTCLSLSICELSVSILLAHTFTGQSFLVQYRYCNKTVTMYKNKLIVNFQPASITCWVHVTIFLSPFIRRPIGYGNRWFPISTISIFHLLYAGQQCVCDITHNKHVHEEDTWISLLVPIYTHVRSHNCCTLQGRITLTSVVLSDSAQESDLNRI